jgi:phage shock protein C
MESKKLYRSRDNVMIAGVLGGIAEYLGLDPTIIRLLCVFLTLFTALFPGLIFYAAAAFIMPRQ